jgi:transcriptional regulator with XRE-family HTH domain
MLAQPTCRVNPLQRKFVGSANSLLKRVRYHVGMAQSKRSPLSNWIRALREQRDETQVVAAEGIGISRTHLSNIETGKDRPGRETLLAIAAYYKASVDQLISLLSESSKKNEMTTSKPEQLLELAVLFLGQERGDPARYARRLSLIHKALQDAQRDGKTVTAETVPGIVADALDRPPDDAIDPR